MLFIHTLRLCISSLNCLYVVNLTLNNRPRRMPPKRFPKREPAGRKPPADARQNVAALAVAGTSSALEESNDNYEEELAWCIHRLKISLNAKNLTPKQIEDMKRNVAILENPKESLVKKRCLMKTSLGNYRHQMEKEKSKLTLELKNAAINNTSSNTGHYLRKSNSVAVSPEGNKMCKMYIQPSDNSFRFNFDNEHQE